MVRAGVIWMLYLDLVMLDLYNSHICLARRIFIYLFIFPKNVINGVHYKCLWSQQKSEIKLFNLLLSTFLFKK